MGPMSFGKGPGICPRHGPVPQGVAAVVAPDGLRRKFIAASGVESSFQSRKGIAESFKGFGPGLGPGFSHG